MHTARRVQRNCKYAKQHVCQASVVTRAYDLQLGGTHLFEQRGPCLWDTRHFATKETPPWDSGRWVGGSSERELNSHWRSEGPSLHYWPARQWLQYFPYQVGHWSYDLGHIWLRSIDQPNNFGCFWYKSIKKNSKAHTCQADLRSLGAEKMPFSRQEQYGKFAKQHRARGTGHAGTQNLLWPSGLWQAMEIPRKNAHIPG